MIPLHGARPAAPARAVRPCLPRVAPAAAPTQGGQSVTEFALVVPLFILLVLAVYGFGLLFQAKISLDNAVRDAARYASQYPTAWNSTSSAPPNTIEGRLMSSGGIAQITASNITIQYSSVTVSGSTSTITSCATYAGSAVTKSCVATGNQVTVIAKVNYQVPVPIVSNVVGAIYKSGVPLQSSTSMIIEQCTDTTNCP